MIKNHTVVDSTVTPSDIYGYSYIPVLPLQTLLRSANVDAVVVKAHESVELSYTDILGADCESTIYHVWTCMDTN